LVSSWYW